MNEKTKDMLRENIRKNLINLRKNKGMSQQDLAIFLGKKNTTVASWEQGLSLPDVTTLYKLSKYYNRMMEYLYEDHEEDA